MKPKVYVTRRMPDTVTSRLRDRLDVDIWDVEDEPVPRDTLLRSVNGVQGVLCLLTDRIDEEFLRAAPEVRVVANMAVGYDNIDVAACTRHKVMITNTPGVLTETTADLAFGLLLATARRIPESEQVLLKGQWKTWSPMFLAGLDVHGATLGIAGLGRIGEAVAKRAQGFSMRLLYWDKVRKLSVEESLGVEYRRFDDLLRESDFITIHLPLEAETRGLFGEREFGLMKPSAVLINTARGPIVQMQALYDALVGKKIWAAGLDVYDADPVSPDDPVVNLDNVVALPHIGSASIATRVKMASMAAENLIAGLSGAVPPNLVNAVHVGF